MRGRGLWVLGWLMFGCVGMQVRPSQEVSPASLASSPAPLASSPPLVAEPPPRPACSLPDDVTIAVHGADVLVNGTHIEELAADAQRPTALTRLLVPCRDHDIHFRFELEPQGSAQLSRLLLHELPHWPSESAAVRFGTSPALPVRLALPKSAAGHWVRLVVESEHIRALELEGGDGPEKAQVVRRTMADA
jgi:hypothetical protein